MSDEPWPPRRSLKPPEKDEPRLLAEDGKPGCPVTVWDGPYSYRCSLGATVGRCAYHGPFASGERGDPPASAQ